MASRSGGRLRAEAPSGRVRIIGGRWKRTPLEVPAVPGLRPTPDRVRETLFNWLGQSLEGWRCLDLFAGSGALGLEAASRGAARVVMVERDRNACRAIAQTIVRLSAAPVVELIEGDAIAALSALSARREPRFDLVFLDPPFAQQSVDRFLAAIEPLLGAGGLVYVEAGESFDAPAERWTIERHGQAGQVHYHLLRRVVPVVDQASIG